MLLCCAGQRSAEAGEWCSHRRGLPPACSTRGGGLPSKVGCISTHFDPPLPSPCSTSGGTSLTASSSRPRAWRSRRPSSRQEEGAGLGVGAVAVRQGVGTCLGTWRRLGHVAAWMLCMPGGSSPHPNPSGPPLLLFPFCADFLPGAQDCRPHEAGWRGDAGEPGPVCVAQHADRMTLWMACLLSIRHGSRPAQGAAAAACALPSAGARRAAGQARGRRCAALRPARRGGACLDVHAAYLVPAHCLAPDLLGACQVDAKHVELHLDEEKPEGVVNEVRWLVVIAWQRVLAARRLRGSAWGGHSAGPASPQAGPPAAAAPRRQAASFGAGAPSQLR